MAFSPVVGVSMISQEQRRFTELYTRYQHRVYGYIATLVPHWSDAEEIFQQSSTVLWEKWEQYDPQRDFVPWACGIARLEVLKYRSRRERRWEGLSDEAVALVEEDMVASTELFSARYQALERCLDGLARRQRDLLTRCYSGKQTIRTVAEQLGKTPDMVYSQLARIRRALHRCVDRKLAVEDGS